MIYAVVFNYHVRYEGRIVKRPVYIAIGIDMDGHKDILGMYVGQNESAKFWLSILNGLKNRGVQDILTAYVDVLSGLPQAIEAVFPKTGNTAAHHPSDQKYYKICFLQRDQATDDRSKTCIYGSNRRNCSF